MSISSSAQARGWCEFRSGQPGIYADVEVHVRTSHGIGKSGNTDALLSLHSALHEHHLLFSSRALDASKRHQIIYSPIPYTLLKFKRG